MNEYCQKNTLETTIIDYNYLKSATKSATWSNLKRKKEKLISGVLFVFKGCIDGGE